MNWTISSRSKYSWSMLLTILVLGISASLANAWEVMPLPLAEPGSYSVGTRELAFIDERRDGREIEVTLWYPATEAAENAAPDRSHAPYPLILYSHGDNGNRIELKYLMQHLASHGFFVAAMEQKGHAGQFVDLDYVDRSMDVLFVLDQLASLSKGDLPGMIDSDNSGVTGYSGGGYDSIMVSGARWDDDYHWKWCEQYPGVYPQVCTKSDRIYAYRARCTSVPARGELWPPLSDRRIKVVLPLAGGAGPAFGV